MCIYIYIHMWDLVPVELPQILGMFMLLHGRLQPHRDSWSEAHSSQRSSGEAQRILPSKPPNVEDSKARLRMDMDLTRLLRLRTSCGSSCGCFINFGFFLLFREVVRHLKSLLELRKPMPDFVRTHVLEAP